MQWRTCDCEMPAGMRASGARIDRIGVQPHAHGNASAQRRRRRRIVTRIRVATRSRLHYIHATRYGRASELNDTHAPTARTDCERHSLTERLDAMLRSKRQTPRPTSTHTLRVANDRSWARMCRGQWTGQVGQQSRIRPDGRREILPVWEELLRMRGVTPHYRLVDLLP